MNTPQEVFDDMVSTLSANSDRTEGLVATYQYTVHGSHGGMWTLIIDDGKAELRSGGADKPDVMINIDEADLFHIAQSATNLIHR